MADHEKLRTLLVAQRRETITSIADQGGTIDLIVAARQDSNNDDEHDPEGSTLAFERSQSDALLQQAQQRLREIDAALARMNAGSYGLCVACGKAIASARLAARPYAAKCIECAG